MDDFNVSALHESKNEWASRLLIILTPLIIEGLKSIFDESLKLCKENNELEKYLMTFQNFISRIPKWNSNIIESEKKRILEKSGCSYLEDLILCVHIIQLKLLTSMRVGQKQKKIDINVPKLDEFIHKVYIHVARKIYKNVYLFEVNIAPLQIQKNNRELEVIVQECILNSIRETIPVESVLRAYMDETIEEDVIEEIKEEIIEKPQTEVAVVAESKSESRGKNELEKMKERMDENKTDNDSTEVNEPKLESSNKLSFNNIDFVRDMNNQIEEINAPKDIDRLEEISNIRNIQRRMESEDDYDNQPVKLKIFNDVNVPLEDSMIKDIEPSHTMNLIPDLLIDDIEILE